MVNDIVYAVVKIAEKLFVAQYYKCDMDYTYTFLFNEKNSLSLHVGAGVAVPYGNSEILPFEKRYFSGGANSVRGWSVRSLGPGSYQRKDPTSDFMNQCGDVRLDFNIEYRSKLIWKLELAAFIDAGNIWTIKDYMPSFRGRDATQRNQNQGVVLIRTPMLTLYRIYLF